jgi:hypothetical protein
MRGKIAPMTALEIVYVAFGRTHIREAAISAWSAKQHMPNIQTSLSTDEMVECTFFDRIELVERGPSGIPLAKQAKLHKLTDQKREIRLRPLSGRGHLLHGRRHQRRPDTREP